MTSAGKFSIKANNSLRPSPHFASDPFKCVKFRGHKSPVARQRLQHGPAGVLSPVQGPTGSSLLLHLPDKQEIAYAWEYCLQNSKYDIGVMSLFSSRRLKAAFWFSNLVAFWNCLES